MPGTLNIKRLLGLLQEQRREVATRSFEVRGSQAWDASCERLDRINERIMRSRDDVPVRPTVVDPLSAPPVGPSDRGRPHH
jgi:hypothetical protein